MRKTTAAVSLKSNSKPFQPSGGLPDWDAALSQSVPTVVKSNKPPVSVPKAGRKSRFFFMVHDESLAAHKESFKPPAVEHVDKAVVDHVKRVESKIPGLLSSNIEEIRQFFVDDLSPLTLAVGTGGDQAREVLKRVTGVEVSPEAFYRFEQMAHQAVLIRLSLFLEKFMGLPMGSASELMPKPTPRPTQQQPSQPKEEETSTGRKDLKSLHRTLQNILDSNEKGTRHDKSKPLRDSASKTKGGPGPLPPISPIQG